MIKFLNFNNVSLSVCQRGGPNGQKSGFDPRKGRKLLSCIRTTSTLEAQLSLLSSG